MTLIRRPESFTVLETADAVIDAVGGTMAASRLVGLRAQQISLARKTGWFPFRTYLRFAAELEARQLQAPASLWRIDEPSPNAAP